MHSRFAAILLAMLSLQAYGQTYTIKTFAGGALPENIPGTSASLGDAPWVASDANGNLFIPVFSPYALVLRLDAKSGILTRVAGNGVSAWSNNNGPATSAPLCFPTAVSVDPAGSIYIADECSIYGLPDVIRKVANGVITIVAGGGKSGLGDGGPAASAQLKTPYGLAVDSTGNLYIADTGNFRIRQVSNGVITTLAGNGTKGSSGDGGPPTSAQLDQPTGVAVDGAGNVYIADRLWIRKVSKGVITNLAGNGTQGFSGDGGPPTNAQFSFAAGVAVDPANNVYIGDVYNNRIRKISNGIITTVTGGGKAGLGDNGPPTQAQLNSPNGLALDTSGALYIADGQNFRIRKVTGGVITTVAGNGANALSGDGGLATNAQLGTPAELGIDPAGSVYVADKENNSVRKVSNGVISTVQPPSPVRNFLDGGMQITVDNRGNIYSFTDVTISRVSNGMTTLVAGNGGYGFGGDGGPAVKARITYPLSLTVDAAGNLYFVDYGNGRVRKVSNGVISTVAGNGVLGFTGDGGSATSAQLFPRAIAVDSAGDLYIADENHHRIRKVSNGVITTVAGDGTCCGGGDDGPATGAGIGAGTMAVDSSGNIYTLDGAGTFGSPISGTTIRRISGGVISVIAGQSNLGGFSGDGGPAINAGITAVFLAVDDSGNVYATDHPHHRIRVLVPSALPCSYSVTPGTLQSPLPGGNLTVTVQTSAYCSWAVQSLPAWITFSGQAVGTGTGTVTLAVAANVGVARSATISIAGVSVPATQLGAMPPPSIQLGGVVPVNSSVNTIQPGEWVSIYGTNLAGSTATWNGNFPTSLSGTSVTINGKAAYLSYVSTTQINLQAPSDTATGSVTVVVTTAVGTATATVTLAQFAPSFFLLDSKHVAGIIPRSNGSGAYGGGTYDILGPTGNSLGYPTVAAKAGDVIELFGTGLGPTSPAVPAGQTFTDAAPTTNPVNLLINNMTVTPAFAGLSGAGLYQINLTVPAGLGTGDVSLQASVGGVQTPPTVVISLQ